MRPSPQVSRASQARAASHPRLGERETAAAAHSRGAAEPGSDGFPRARRLSWAQLMQRVFLVDVFQCPRCAGRMRLIAAIVDGQVVARILAYLGLPARAPPLTPARDAPTAWHSDDPDTA